MSSTLRYGHQKYSRSRWCVPSVRAERAEFQNVPSGRWRSGQSVEGKECRPTQRLRYNVKVGPVYDIALVFREMGFETRFRCFRVSEGWAHLTEVKEDSERQHSFEHWHAIYCYGATAAGNRSSCRHYGLGRSPFSIARRSFTWHLCSACGTLPVIALQMFPCTRAVVAIDASRSMARSLWATSP
jgi:hypothetical protein